MIIGTYVDAVSVNEDDLSKNIYHMYSDSCSFPTIADVCFVSNIQGRLTTLRNRIFSVAIRLRFDGNNRC